ncbi:MAG: serine/threonine-protein kinase [Planctomycetota bacterium]|nr:serine/threonine-protein kinase [Planctomycetota bacterium]
MTTGDAIKRDPSDLADGTRIGRYRIESPVGRGGMGTVYRAFDEKTNRTVAVKLLAAGIPEGLRNRFLAECEAEANIRHEHVMPVYDRGWLNPERPYFVMELLYEPLTLADLVAHIQKGTLGQAHPRLRHWNDLQRLIADVLLPICEGVAVANVEYGVQHRDLKPDNVLLDIRTKRPYLIDFGICRSMDEARDRGKIIGTPRFLSPEQARAEIDHRTDVWGLGALLRFVVTGEPPLAATSPFTRREVDQRIVALREAEAAARAGGEDAKARGYAVRREQLEDPTLRVQEDLLRDAVDGLYVPLPESASLGLRAVIQKAMATSPGDRYSDAHALCADLRTWLRGGGVQAISERGARGAAMDWARRLLNRNVVRAAGTLLALGAGWIVGNGIFRASPPPVDHRLPDALATLGELQGEVRALATSDVAPLGNLAVDWLLERRIVAAGTRLQDLVRETDVAQPEGTQLAQRLAAMLRSSRVTIEGGPGGTLGTDALLALPTSATLTPDALTSGAFQLQSKDRAGLFLRFVVPRQAGLGFSGSADAGLERVVRLGTEPTPVPAGLTWIPAGSVEAGDDRVLPPFLVNVRRVTNEKYSEWLDDLAPEERGRRVPAAGFRRDEREPRRWLAIPQDAMKPVLGIRAEDAAAYAAWRSAAEGVAVRLPTTLEWQRMAALDTTGDPAGAVLLPWCLPTSRRSAQRRGDAASSPAPDLSPYGVRDLYSGGGELVTGAQPGTFGVHAAGGVLPVASGLRRMTPIDADASGHAYGFRLIIAR